MSLKRWHVETITLAVDGEPSVEMVAEVRGEWAYGKTPDAVQSLFVWGYQVTHAPSGRLVRAGLQNKTTARKIVLRLSRLPEIGTDPSAHPEITAQVWQIIREEEDAAMDRALKRSEAGRLWIENRERLMAQEFVKIGSQVGSV